jgi:hypothetical protein
MRVTQPFDALTLLSVDPEPVVGSTSLKASPSSCSGPCKRDLRSAWTGHCAKGKKGKDGEKKV